MDILQDQRGAKISTPLGPNVLSLRSFTFNEHLNSDFDGRVEALSTDANIDPRDMIGQSVTIELDTMNPSPRYFNAIVSKFRYAGAIGRHSLYEIMLVPWMQVLSLRQDCRVFTDMTAVQVIEKIFENAEVKDMVCTKNLADTYRSRELCIQYNETDENFIRRLMMKEGINSFYRHSDGKHELVLTDKNDKFDTFGGYETLKYFPKEAQRRADGEHIYSWVISNAVNSGTYTSSDYDFKIPNKSLVTISTQRDKHKNDDKEVFHWPGNYTEHSDGQRYSDIHREQTQNLRSFVSGESNARGLSAGHTFSLDGFPKADVNGAYLVTTVHHNFQATDYESLAGGGSGTTLYENSFTCSDPTLLYRGFKYAEPPIINGPQTAVVVGDKEKNEEIWTDEYARIQIRFHWDRHWDEDAANSDKVNSAWIRVVQKWAGPSWGWQHIPRVGQEVLVEFLDGNPDYPIVTGAVYNGNNKPPFSLPENKTQSGVRSNSTKDATGANELLFEDMKEKENIFSHAQKDYTERVLNTRTTRIDSHEVRSVGDNEYVAIDKASHRHVGNTSINIVGGTGPSAMITAAGQLTHFVPGLQFLATSKEVKGTASSEGGNIGIATIAGYISGLAANGYAAHAQTNFGGLVAGEDPIADAGRALNVNGQALGDGTISAALPFGTNVDIAGVTNVDLVGAVDLKSVGGIKYTYVGMHDIKGIQFNDYLKVGKDQTIKIGKNQKEDIGEDQDLTIGKDRNVNVGDSEFKKIEKNAQMQVGKEYKVLAGQKFLGESKVWEMYSDKKIKMSAPGGFIEITKSGILIRGKKVKIEGKKVDFKKKGGGKGTTCLKGMAKTATPFVK